MRTVSILITIIAFILTSCSKKQNLNNIQSEITKNYCDKYIYCAVGVGNTQKEAELKAKEELAFQIYSIVSSEFEKTIEIAKDVKLSEKKRYKLKTLTTIPLKNIKYIKRGNIDNKYFVVVKVSPDEAKKIRDGLEKIFTALTYVNKIEETKNLSLKITLLKDLINEIRLKNIWDKEFLSLSTGKMFTFRSYIKHQLSNITKEIKLINTSEGLYVVSKKNLFPISGIEILIIDSKSKELRSFTNSEGKIIIPEDFEYPLNTYLIFYNNNKDKDFHIESLFIKESPYINIYISTDPKGLTFELKINGKIEKQGVTPNVTEVLYTPETVYSITLYGKDYKPIDIPLNLKKGYDYYLYKKLEKLKYGFVDFEVEGEGIISIQSIDGKVIVDEKTATKKLKEKLPVGKYNVTIKMMDDNNQYQIVKEKIYITENKTLKRVYYEPQDRVFFREGMGLAFFFGFISNKSLLDFKCKKSNYFSTCDENNPPNFNVAVLGAMGKKFWKHFWVGGRFGLTSISEGSSSSASSDGTLDYMISASGGIYTGENIPLEIGLGYLNLNASETGYDYEVKASISSPFVSVKLSLSGIGIEFRQVFGSNSFSILMFDLGIYSLKKGFRKPKEVEAIKGIHYE
ncbi:hypothetical protein [Persephonella sp.]